MHFHLCFVLLKMKSLTGATGATVPLFPERVSQIGVPVFCVSGGRRWRRPGTRWTGWGSAHQSLAASHPSTRWRLEAAPPTEPLADFPVRQAYIGRKTQGTGRLAGTPGPKWIDPQVWSFESAEQLTRDTWFGLDVYIVLGPSRKKSAHFRTGDNVRELKSTYCTKVQIKKCC